MMNSRVAATLGFLSAAGFSLCLAACGSSPTPAAPTPPAPNVVSVAITGSAPSVGASSQLTATANLSDNTTQNVTSQAAWRSSNTAVLTIAASGIATGVGAGDVEVTASYNNIAGTLRLTLRAAEAATATVSGTLLDDRVGSGLRDGSVSVVDGPDAGKSAAADQSGNYTLSGLARGTIRLRANAAGYDSMEQTITVTGDARVDFRMHQIAVPCAYTVSPAAADVRPPAAAQFAASINRTTGGCSWQATSDASWIAIVGSNSASNSATLNYRIDANQSYSRRSGTITVQWSGGTAQVTVTQQAFDECFYYFSPGNASISGAGQYQAQLQAALATTCSWQARPDVPWLSIVGASSGTGNATIAYAVAPNSSGAARTGTITAVHAGASQQVFTVTQQPASGAACTYAVTPTSIGVSHGGFPTPSAITLTTGAGCAWTASTPAGWLFLRSPDSSSYVHSISGSGSSSIGVGSNVTICHRTTLIEIRWAGGGVDVNVEQGYSGDSCQQ